MGKVLVKRLMLRGFIQSDHLERQPDFLKDMGSGFATERSTIRRTSWMAWRMRSVPFRGYYEAIIAAS